MTNYNNLLTEEILTNYRVICEGFIVNSKGQIFAQKRSETRLKHPNSWNFVGGHLDEGETLVECLHRETKEETGWDILQVLGLIDIFYFDLPTEMLKLGEKSKEIIFKFLVTVDEKKVPILEESKAVDWAWFDATNIEITTQNRHENQGKNYIRDSILQAIKYHQTLK